MGMPNGALAECRQLQSCASFAKLKFGQIHICGLFRQRLSQIEGNASATFSDYRAKRSVAQYCHDKLSVRLSVRPSVTLVDCDKYCTSARRALVQ